MPMLRINTGEGGDKPVAKEEKATGKSRTSLDDTADVRDILNSFIGKGTAGLQDDAARSDYARLQQLLGPEKAQKVMTSVIIHNQRNAAVPMEKRIQTFYDVGSNDADVDGIIKNVKSFGTGPLAGFRDSSKQSNQLLSGRIPGLIASNENPSLQEKVMLRLK